MSVKVGFLGMGGMANHHLKVLSKLGGVEFVAFCDKLSERAESAAKEQGGRAYTDYKKMLEKELLDALFICLPPDAHGDEEILAAKQGIHLFIEKPIALDLKKAKEIEEVIKISGIVCSVGYRWRYLDITKRAKEILEGKKVGMVLGYWMGGVPGANWWGEMKRSGGQMVEQTTHIVDLSRYLVGDVERVYALYGKNILSKEREGFNLPDVGSMLLQFKEGIIGTISNTCLLELAYTVGLNIVAKDLVLESQGGRLKIIEPRRREEIYNQNDDVLTEDDVFLKAVKTKDTSKVLSSYSDALKTLAVTLAANQSAESGKVIELEVGREKGEVEKWRSEEWEVGNGKKSP
ncbi:MAG: oxidoreductase [Armatimonadetes bacterium CG07_land_8_20_14_0_80_40_9]|nr:MAG: oxidoreductase [Armatimonadetes bacterium CG07_land_8_20_14_0_80_40_9]